MEEISRLRYEKDTNYFRDSAYIRDIHEYELGWKE